jgi:hypothetical protein
LECSRRRQGDESRGFGADTPEFFATRITYVSVAVLGTP